MTRHHERGRQARHYDVVGGANQMRLGVLRDRLFTAPDARGNIPHLTRETSDAESRRLNATMYETVGEAAAALDPRVQAPQRPAPGSTGGSFVGSLVLIGLGAALLWAVFSDDEEDDEVADAKDVTPSTTVVRENPVPREVVVVPPPAQHTTTNINPPVPVVVPPPRRRRKRVSKPVAPTITVEMKTEPTKVEEKS